MVHSHAVHFPLGALLIWCTMCGTGDWPYFSTIKADRSFHRGLRDAVSARAVLEPMAARYPAVHYLPLFEHFCDGPLPANETSRPPACKPVVPNTSVDAYSPDGSHLSEVGSVYLWPFVCDAMDAMGLG